MENNSMEEVGRKYRICFIDYMWYVAGKWSEREHNNLDGGMLLFLCWLFVILIPVATPLACCYFGMGGRACCSDILMFPAVLVLQDPLYGRTAHGTPRTFPQHEASRQEALSYHSHSLSTDAG